MLTIETMPPRKLQLAKETLRALTPLELRLVAGGDSDSEWHHHHWRHHWRHSDSDSDSDGDGDSNWSDF